MISFSGDSKSGIFVISLISFFQIVSSILPVKVTGDPHFACKEERNFPPKINEILSQNDLAILKQQGVNEKKNCEMCFKWNITFVLFLRNIEQKF